MTDPSSPPEDRNPHRETFADFATLLDQYCEGIRSVLVAEGQAEQAEVLAVLRQALTTQAESLSAIFRDVYDAQDADGRETIDGFLRSTGARGMIDQALALLENPSMQKKSLMGWLTAIVELLKEILLMIADLLNLPEKIIHLIMAILEILQKILKFLANLFGTKNAQLVDEFDRIFWTSLERYWNTTAALRRNGILQ